jgi:hypothetical protein
MGNHRPEYHIDGKITPRVRNGKQIPPGHSGRLLSFTA